mgnify:FL=1
MHEERPPTAGSTHVPIHPEDSNLRLPNGRPILNDVEQDALARFNQAKKPPTDPTTVVTFARGMEHLAMVVRDLCIYNQENAATIRSAVEDLRHAADMLEKAADDITRTMPL